jgi:hypothetical protein
MSCPRSNLNESNKIVHSLSFAYILDNSQLIEEFSPLIQFCEYKFKERIQENLQQYINFCNFADPRA